MKAQTQYPTVTPSSLRGLLIRLLIVLALLLLLPACVTEVPVTRHSSTALDNVSSRSILHDFSVVLLTADSPQDFACASDYGQGAQNAAYIQVGSVGIHNGPAVINSSADFSALIAEPGYVKVVEEINWCGSFSPNIVGCAPTPGNSFAVVRIGSQVEGILWAHEFGHTVGLGHRSSSTAVMNSSLNINRREITSDECESFLEKHNPNWPAPPPSSATVEQAVPDRQMVLDGHVETEHQGSTDVLSFVRTIYPHGTPMGEALQFENTNAVPQLLAMLLDEEETAYWGNIVAVLGMIGDITVAPTLIEFANQQAVREDGAGSRNVSAAMMGLGYLANRTDDPQAVAFLRAAGSSAHWTASPERARQLAIGARIGLAFSGQAMPDTLARSTQEALPAELAAELDALRNEISSLGVVEYYRGR